MKEYFKLQFRIINRKLNDFGIQPVLFYPLSLIIFIALSVYIFSKSSFAPYTYILIALSCATTQSEVRRNDFLKICFPNKLYWKIRSLENLIIIFPFAAFLIFKLFFIPAIMLAMLAVLPVFINLKSDFNLTIPTPFYKKPFEFVVGFRNTFWLFVAAYFLSIMAIIHYNFNLGVFSLLLVFIICLSFYSKPENEYFVWSYNLTATKFLFEKIKTALLFSAALSLPILLALSIYFLDKVGWLLLSCITGGLYLTAIILAKYAAYPKQMNLPQAFLIIVSLYLPLLLIGIIPFLYVQSIKKLNDLLE